MIENNCPRCWHTTSDSGLPGLNNPTCFVLIKPQHIMPTIMATGLPKSALNTLNSFDWNTKNLVLISLTCPRNSGKKFGFDCIQQASDANSIALRVISYDSPFTLVPNHKTRRDFLLIPVPKKYTEEQIVFSTLKDIAIPNIQELTSVDDVGQFDDFRRLCSLAPNVPRDVIPENKIPEHRIEIFPFSEKEQHYLTSIFNFQHYVSGTRI